MRARIFILLAIFFVSIGFSFFITLKLNSLEEKQILLIDAPTLEKELIVYPLAWESKNPSTKKWSKFLYKEIEKRFDDFEARDMGYFCENYDNLRKEEKINVWAQLISLMAFYESSWNPMARYVESNLGIDPVTKSAIASEGLLQVGYIDSLYHKCNFAWETDAKLSETDAKKTVFDPYNNLQCGVIILAKQLKTHKAIVINKGAYWAVIKQGHKNSKVAKLIKELNEYEPCLIK